MNKIMNVTVLIVSLIGSPIALALTADVVAIPRLLQLSTISTQAAIDEVIALGSEGSTNKIRQQYLFTALIRIGPSVSGDAFAKSILDAGSASSTMLRGALGYLAEHPTPWMSHYATQYISANNAGEVRAMAAYLAGRLKLVDQQANVIDVVNNSTIGGARIHAALGLSHLLGGEGFAAVLVATNMTQADKRLITTYNDFLWADESQKATLLPGLTRRSETFLALAAFDYLLANNKVEQLKQLHIIAEDANGLAVASHNQYKALLRMLAYKIKGNFDVVTIEKSPLL